MNKQDKNIQDCFLPSDIAYTKEMSEITTMKHDFLLCSNMDSIVTQPGERLTLSFVPELLKENGKKLGGVFGTKATAYVPTNEGQSIIAADVDPKLGTISCNIPKNAVSGVISFKALYNNELLFINGTHVILACGACQNDSICPYGAIKVDEGGFCSVDQDICKGHTRAFVDRDAHDEPNMTMSIHNSRVAALVLSYCLVDSPIGGEIPTCADEELNAELLSNENDIVWNDDKNPFNPTYTTKTNHYLYLSEDLINAGLPVDSKTKITKLSFKVSGQPTSNLPEFRISASMQVLPEDQEAWNGRILFQNYVDATHGGVVYGPTEISTNNFTPGQWIDFELEYPIIWESGNNLLLELSSRNLENTTDSNGGIFERETNGIGYSIRHTGGISNLALAYPYSDTRRRKDIDDEEICFECFAGDEKYSTKCIQRRLQRVLSIENCCGCCDEIKTAVEGYCLPDYCPHNAISGGDSRYGRRCPHQTGGNSPGYIVDTSLCTGCMICFDSVYCVSMSMKAHIHRGFYNQIFFDKLIVSPGEGGADGIIRLLSNNEMDLSLLVWGSDRNDTFHKSIKLEFQKEFGPGLIRGLFPNLRKDMRLVANIENGEFVSNENLTVAFFPKLNESHLRPGRNIITNMPIGRIGKNDYFLPRTISLEREEDYPVSKRLVFKSQEGNLLLYYRLVPYFSDPDSP